MALQQLLAVGDRNRVAVDVDDPGSGIDGPGDLVHVAGSGDARAEIEELVDAVATQVLYGAAEEGAVVLRVARQRGHGGEHVTGEGPVGLEVVRATQVEVVDPRDARLREVHFRRCPARPTRHRPHPRPVVRRAPTSTTYGVRRVPAPRSVSGNWDERYPIDR